ncbi:MAG: Ig-like domain-containing protein [Beijerinckiaceae bacterium]
MSTLAKTRKTKSANSAKGMEQRTKLPSLDVAAKPGIELLEPRLVFDASFDAADDAPLAVCYIGGDNTGAGVSTEADVAPVASPPLPQPVEQPRQEIVFINGSLADIDTLKAAAPAGAEVHVLSAGQDGLRQMADILNGRGGIDAVHILSHGEAGEVHLGSGTLTVASAGAEHRAALETIGRSLSADADILVYGCDVASNEAGRTLVQTIAGITGADVAASDDLTGLGGDWDLEVDTGLIETGGLRAETWSGVLSLTNTGNWSVAGTTATNTTASVTTTMTFSVGAGGLVSLNAVPQTLNTTTAFFANGAAADPALGFTYTWDTTPEVAAGAPQPDAAADDVPMTVTITFSTAIANPIIHIDRLGGNGTIGTDSRSNSSLWTLNTPGATLTKLAGVDHLEVTSTTFQRTPNTVMATTGVSGEASTNALNSTAAGSIRVNGTFTSLSFTVSGAGVEGAAADGIEIALTVEPPPVARDDAFTMLANTTLNGNLFANNGSGADADPQGDALAITAVNGVAFTVGTPIAIANGTLTITNGTTGAFTFVPNANYMGPASFSYAVADPSGATSTATASITVQLDTDNDEVADVNDIDDDNDGVTDVTEGRTALASAFAVNGREFAITPTVRTPTGTSGQGVGSIAVYELVDPGNPSIVVGYLRGTVTDIVGNSGGPTTVTWATLDGQPRVRVVSGNTDFNTYESAEVKFELFETSSNLTTLLAGGTGDPLIATFSVDNGDLDKAPGRRTERVSASLDEITAYTVDANTTLTVAEIGTPGRIVATSTADNIPDTLVPPDTIRFSYVNRDSFVIRFETTGDSAGFQINMKSPVNFPNAVDRIAAGIDSDNDGISDHLDIDSDNDGITDNVEAQTTAGYIAPSGTGAAMLDTDNDGLDDRYDATRTTGAIGSNGLIPVNTDSTDSADYLDTDSDNDGKLDAAERGTAGPTTAATGLSTAANDADGDGLFDVFEGASTTDGFDVNDENRTAAAIALSGVPALNASGSNAVPLVTDSSFRDVNDPPVDGNETNTVTEDTVLTVADGAAGDLLANATDADGDAPVITGFTIAGIAGTQPVGSAISIPGVGSVTINADGSYSFTPVANYTGAIPVITYTVSDGNGGTDTSTLILNITPVNDPPVATDDTNTTAEDTPASGNVITGGTPDMDPDNDALQLTQFTVAGFAGTFSPGQTATIPGVGQLVMQLNGSYTFTPAANYTGPVPLATYTISDGKGGTDTATLSILVGAVNDPPVATDNAKTLTEDQPATDNLLTDDTPDSDADNDPLVVTQFTVAGMPGSFGPGQTATIPGVGQLIVNSDGSYTFTPSPEYNGPVPSVTYTVSDGKGGTDTAVLTLTVAPVDDTGAITNLADNAGNLAGTDAQVKESDLPTGTSPTGTGETATGTFTIADKDGIASLSVGGTVITLAQLQAATPLAPITIASPTYGSITITGFNPATGAVSYSYTLDTSAPNVNGAPLTESIALAIVDVLGNTTPGTLAIAILDDAPVATNDVDRVISTPGNPSSIAVGNVVTGAPSAGDPNTSDGTADTAGADALGAAPVSGVVVGNGAPVAGGVGVPVPGLFGSLTLNANGGYTYTPDYGNPAVSALGPNDSLNDVFTYEITDADGSKSTATLTLSITGTPAIINAGSANPAGVDGTVKEADLPVGTTPSGTGETITGSFTAVVSGPDVLASVTIAGTPYTPAQLLAATPASPIIITTPLGVLEVTGFDPLTGDVSYEYTLTAPQNHSTGPVFDTIPVSVTSNLGDTANGNLRFAVADDAPLATNDADTVSENGTAPATGNVFTGVDASGGDPNITDGTADNAGADAPANPVTAVGAGTGAPASAPGAAVAGLYGTLTLNGDGSYSYQPNRTDPVVNALTTGQSLTDVFTYEITDADGDKVTATLTVAIIGVNDPVVMVDPQNPGVPGLPTPAPDPLNVIPDITAPDSTSPPQILVSDYIRDPESGPVTYDATGLPPGLIIDPATGLISGVLPIDASQGGPNGDGVYPVTVTITDNGGNVTTTTITYTITNPPPVALNDAATVTEDITATGNLLDNDSDPDGDPLAVTGFTVPGLAGTFLPGSTATMPGVGTLTIAADGGWSFTPSPNYDGPVPPVTYTITDKDGALATAVLTLTMQPVNDAPVVVDPTNPGTPLNPVPTPDPQNIIPDVTAPDSTTPPVIDVSDYIRDPEGDPLTYETDGLPPGLTIDPVTGVISGDLPNDASQGGPNGDGVYPVTVTVTDIAGNKTTTTITYTVTNPPPVAVDDSNTVSEDGPPVVGSVLVGPGADSDPDGDPLTVVSASWNGQPVPIGQPFVLPNGAVLTLNPDGTYSFDPGTAYDALPVGETALEAIQYVITDADGAQATASLTLTIVGVNDAPKLVDPNNPGNPNPDPLVLLTPNIALDSTPVVIRAGDVFVDPEGRPLTFDATGMPPGLSIDPVTGVISGVIGADASQGGPNGDGIYPITLIVRDPDGGVREVTFPFTALNPPPVALNNQARADRPNTPVTIDVLPNDSDPDGDNLTIVEATSPDGEVIIESDGRIRFIPSRGFSGSAVITYTIADGHGGFATATVIVDVPPEDNHIAPSAPLWPMDMLDGKPAGQSPFPGTGYIVLDALRWNGSADDILARFKRDAESPLHSTLSDVATRTFLGTSIARVSADTPSGEKLWVETMMHERQFVLKVWQEDSNGKRSMVDYRLITDRDLRWLERLGRDIHGGVPPVTQDRVELDVEAVMASGEVVRRQLVIEPRLGQVRLQEPELSH